MVSNCHLAAWRLRALLGDAEELHTPTASSSQKPRNASKVPSSFTISVVPCSSEIDITSGFERSKKKGPAGFVLEN
jgi:hypothetical protein